MCYGDWSSLGHVTSFTRYLSTLNAKPAFEAVRRPNELQLVSQMAAILLLRATREMIGTFRSGENLTPWYSRDVRPFLKGLAALEVTVEPRTEP